jgi:alkylated DNA nucleotide flippase Atl1
MGKTKSWRTKMSKPATPEVKQAPDIWTQRYGGDKMLIPTPQLVQQHLNAIPQGKLMTMTQLRERMAADCGADFSCPMTTGIFSRIVAESAEEERAEDAPTITPYWRLLKDDGTLNPKFPNGQQEKILREEGFWVLQKGKNNLQVADFQQFLV